MIKKKDKKIDSGTALEIMSQTKPLVFLQTAFYTLSSIAIFGGTGYLLDKTFTTKPLFLIVFLIISYPLTQYWLYKKFTGSTEKKLAQKRKLK